MEEITTLGQNAKAAAKCVGTLSAGTRNEILLRVAENLVSRADFILAQNREDWDAAQKNGVKPAMIDRLSLSHARIEGMAKGLRELAAQPDPIGEVISAQTRPNGLKIANIRTPIGVIAMIYESRPNVTVDAFGIAIKSGNAIILRGGSDAALSNAALILIIRDTIASLAAETGRELDINMAQIVRDTSRDAVGALMRLNAYVDVLIPRGGAGLIQSVLENATVPVIETGVGNCHVFVDKSADFDMAANIIVNAKTTRVGVCNAAEKLLVHRDIAADWLPAAAKELAAKNVEIRGDAETLEILGFGTAATEEDWAEEYLDYILGVKIVADIDEAMEHIAKYSSHHSEAIVTSDYANATKFCDGVDSAAVYVNASTRFTDGGEFGLGAEIGISTQKMHARGPLGIRELTSNKFIILGNGQVR